MYGIALAAAWLAVAGERLVVWMLGRRGVRDSEPDLVHVDDAALDPPETAVRELCDTRAEETGQPHCVLVPYVLLEEDDGDTALVIPRKHLIEEMYRGLWEWVYDSDYGYAPLLKLVCWRFDAEEE